MILRQPDTMEDAHDKSRQKLLDQVFSNRDILFNIFRFVEKEHFFYTARVNRTFRALSRGRRPRSSVQEPPVWTKVAAEWGDFDFLAWCLKASKRKKLVCAAFANRGRLDLLQQARLLRCPWDARTCFFAAISGNLHIIKWARSEGCPWDEWTVRIAEAKGYTEIAEWASANGCY